MENGINPDRQAELCDDQLPVIARVGRGIKGDGFKVVISDPDTNCETHLEGMSYDEATKLWTSEWLSENINGGCLSYQYKLRPYANPATFTMTFIYRRPGRPEWSWTTPSIPYVWNVDDDGGRTDPDAIVGSGVATIFLRSGASNPWVEKLVYPDGTTREDYNAPAQGEAWTSNITFGYGGDVEVPNLDDIAKIIGVSKDTIVNILNSVPGALAGSDNVKDYVDDQNVTQTTTILNHVHNDLGWGGEMPSGVTVKKYIDDRVTELNNRITQVSTDLTDLINALGTKNANTLADILTKIYLGGTINSSTGAITWPTADKIALGNINVYSGGSAGFIKTHADGENDLKAE